MGQKLQWLVVILTIVLIILVALLLNQLPIKNFYELKNVGLNQTEQVLVNSPISSSPVKTFLPNIRFPTNQITYMYDVGCSDTKKQRVKQAFEILSNLTQELSFTEITDAFTAEKIRIKIFCSDSKKSTGNNTFIAGEGGPVKMINLSIYSLIDRSELYIYGNTNENCAYPVVEIHELLHAFGFDHVDDKTSILYPVSYCAQRIQNSTVQELIRLYSEAPKADVRIVNANVTRQGRYLDLNISILNQGLIDAEDVQVNILESEKNKFLSNFSAETIGPGITKQISIMNLRIPYSSANSLKIILSTKTPEYFTDNNYLVLNS